MKQISLSIVLFLIGGLIYILWRSDSLRMFQWFEQVNIGMIIEVLRDRFGWTKEYIPSWVYLSLPNALWLASGILMFDSVWRSGNQVAKAFWITTFIAIAIGSEIGQALDIVPGTFDWVDIKSMIVAVLVSLAWIYHKQRSNGDLLTNEDRQYS